MVTLDLTAATEIGIKIIRVHIVRARHTELGGSVE